MTTHNIKNYLFGVSLLLVSTLMIAQQTEIEHNSDTGSAGPQLLLLESGDSGAADGSDGWSRLWFKNSADAINRWGFLARPHAGATDNPDSLMSPLVMAYTGVQKFGFGKDGTLRINKKYSLPNVDGSNGQVLTTDGAGNVSWAAGGGGSSLWTEAQGPRYSNTGARFARINSTNGSNTGFMFENNGLQEALIWHEVSSGDLIFTNNNGSTRNMIIDGTTQYVGIGVNNTTPTEMLDVKVTGNDGIRIEGNNTGDARLGISNGGGNHFLFDDYSDNHTLKIESADDFVINTGGTNERFEIDGSTGDVTIREELSVSGEITAGNGIEVRGTEATINFNDSQGAGFGAAIEFAPESNGNGNFGDLEIRNFDAAGEIEFYLSNTTLVMSLDDQSIEAHTRIIPRIDSSPNTNDGLDLGTPGRRWDRLYVDEVVLHGCAAFADRKVTDEIINFPLIEKDASMDHFQNRRGLIEVNPYLLPNGLSDGEGGVLIDEMATYNYKANYEQQQQLNDLKKENATLKNQIATILARLDADGK